MNHFEQLAKIDVSKHIEKKANLSYLSWAHAVDQLMRQDQTANWVFHEPQMFGESMMVSCTVTAFEKPITMHLPVMDNRNQAIKNPDSFQVNKNMMRCLVKAIACHGLGLYIYAGEDLPHTEPEPEPEPRGKPELLALLSGMTTEAEVKGLWAELTAPERASIKTEVATLGKQIKGEA
jgi:hypothetical protein